MNSAVWLLLAGAIHPEHRDPIRILEQITI
jgi:hypothetical protein